MDKNVKKNILDLKYNKYLQYWNTTLILTFTYLIGITIAFITEEINYQDPKQLTLVAVLSSVFLLLMLAFLLTFRNKVNEIPEELKNL